MNRWPARAILADDERLMRDQLALALQQAWPELRLEAQARNGQEALAAVQQWRPEVVFLDIRMPALNGIDTARAIVDWADEQGTTAPEIVFITAYDQYAVEAFEHGAVDYILKPAEPERLAKTVARVCQRLQQRHQDASPVASDAVPPPLLAQVLQQLTRQMKPQASAPLRWIQASLGQSLQMVPVEDVLFFSSDEKYTRVRTATQEHFIRKPIKELIDELDPEVFWPIHRATVVNARAIEAARRDDRGRLVLSLRGCSETLVVSRNHSARFKSM
jgi:DNA-binding LytR/AlgR family response regulator